jgi:hypothetical protein
MTFRKTFLVATAALALAAGATGRAQTGDIVDTAVAAGQFKTLVAAVKAAGLVETLKGPGPFTVFAPTDAAFAKLPKGTVEELLKPENKAKLTAVLTYHVVPGKVLAADVVKLKEAKTVQGQSVSIAVAAGSCRAQPAVVSMATRCRFAVDRLGPRPARIWRDIIGLPRCNFDRPLQYLILQSRVLQAVIPLNGFNCLERAINFADRMLSGDTDRMVGWVFGFRTRKSKTRPEG